MGADPAAAFYPHPHVFPEVLRPVLLSPQDNESHFLDSLRLRGSA